MQLHADDGRARDPGGSPLAWARVVLARANAALWRLHPYHKPGAGWVAYPRCWRSRTAIRSSYRIEQTPTSGWICSSTPTTDARAIPPALPSPARAVVLARANAALSELVPCESEATGEGRVLAIPGRASAFAASLAGGSLVNSGSPALTAAAATKRERSPIRCDHLTPERTDRPVSD